MIKVTPDPEFKADVEITVPGQQTTGTIPLTFRYKTRKQLASLFEKYSKDEVFLITPELMEDIIVSWGLESEFNKENIAIFLDNYLLGGSEILAAYQKLLFESRVKN